MKTPIVAAALAAALSCGLASGQGLVEWHEQAIPGVCVLRLAVPEGWRSESRSQAPGAVEVRLVPAAGPSARVLIVGSAPRGEPLLKRTGDIKKAAREMGEGMLSGAVERSISLERLDGADGSGFFYTLTDARPELPEGEFRVTTQGIMAVGPLRLAVTVQAPEKGSAAQKTAFGVLRTAECQPARGAP